MAYLRFNLLYMSIAYKSILSDVGQNARCSPCPDSRTLQGARYTFSVRQIGSFLAMRIYGEKYLKSSMVWYLCLKAQRRKRRFVLAHSSASLVALALLRPSLCFRVRASRARQWCSERSNTRGKTHKERHYTLPMPLKEPRRVLISSRNGMTFWW